MLDASFTHELQVLYQNLQKCLDLRDKYMRISRQRLGDDPRDHDGEFTGLEEQVQGVAGVRPDAKILGRRSSQREFEPWKVYPKPPPPHWHWKDRKPAVPNSLEYVDEEFYFSKCEIPAADSCGFELDDKGVYQIYEDVEGMS